MRTRDPARNTWPNGYSGTRTSASLARGSGARRRAANVGTGSERRSTPSRVERAPAGAQPPALHVGLLAVGTHLADRHLEVDVALRSIRATGRRCPCRPSPCPGRAGRVSYASPSPLGTGCQWKTGVPSSPSPGARRHGRGSAAGSYAVASAGAPRRAAASASVRPGARYHVVGVVAGGGHDAYVASNAAIGAPAASPAPTSNRTRSSGSAS